MDVTDVSFVMQYIACWRMHLALAQVKEDDAPLAEMDRSPFEDELRRIIRLQLGVNMKTVFIAAFLVAASASAFATPAMAANTVGGQSFSGKAPTLLIEAANRKGSTRVGGSGRSGKGGRYVGGRK